MIPLGCYYVQDHIVLLTEPESIFDLLLSIDNALIEKYPFYWKLTPILPEISLEPDRHSIIQNQHMVEPYCNLCVNRVVSITGGCKTCLFQPMQPAGHMQIHHLIELLKSASFYEVDSSIFTKEVAVAADRSRKKQIF